MSFRLVASALILMLMTACGGPDNSAKGEPAPSLSPAPAPPLRLLVIGGTSGIGLETVRLALDRGHLVTAMARRPERMPFSHPNLVLFKGDVADLNGPDEAVEGQDAVIFTIGIGLTRKPVTVFSEGTRNVLDAMARYDVLQLAMVTGIGAGDSRGHGSMTYDLFFQPILLKTTYEDKNRSEALIRESVVDWVIVRPGFLTNDTSDADYRVIRDMDDVTSGDISRADVAHFLVAAVESEDYWGETLLLTQ